jgi:3-isopropylmalate dehydratase small subunit
MKIMVCLALCFLALAGCDKSQLPAPAAFSPPPPAFADAPPVHMHLNTDGIYGKDYPYRELSRDEMAKVVMENYDPTFTKRVGPGAVIDRGDNFGTGSSREQAATALQAAGIPLVMAGSFSQTYLRNANNNGFVCIECPELVADMRATFATQVAAKEPTIIPGDDIAIDFTTGTAAYRGKSYVLPALGSVPQSLYVAGGIEKLVQRKLGLWQARIHGKNVEAPVPQRDRGAHSVPSRHRVAA